MFYFTIGTILNLALFVSASIENLDQQDLTAAFPAVSEPAKALSFYNDGTQDEPGLIGGAGDGGCRDDPSVVVSEGAIMRMLMNPAKNYSKANRPVRNARDAVVVKIGLRLLGIQDFIERENTLVLNAYLTLNWLDEGLIWNNSYPEKCVPTVSLPASMLWMPDLVLLNAANRGENGYSMLASETAASRGMRAIVSSDGQVDVEPLARLSVSCDIDLMFFPFDTQICPIRFETWVYPRAMQRLEIFAPAFIRNNKMWTENEHWLVVGNRSRAGTDIYGDGTGYDFVIFELQMRRKALFFYVNIIIPCLVISVVEIVIFALPIVEVIKLHISFTCLLAYTVFQTMSISDMPKSGDSVSLLSMYIAAGQANISLALLGEAVVFILISKAQMKKQRVSLGWLMAAMRLGKLIGVRYHTVDETPQTSPHKHSENHHHHQPPEHKSVEEEAPLAKHETSGLSPEQRVRKQAAGFGSPADRPCHTAKSRKFVLGGYDSQWLYLAEIVDRCTCILYMFSIVITPFVVFVVIPWLAKLNTAPVIMDG